MLQNVVDILIIQDVGLVHNEIECNEQENNFDPTAYIRGVSYPTYYHIYKIWEQSLGRKSMDEWAKGNIDFYEVYIRMNVKNLEDRNRGREYAG